MKVGKRVLKVSGQLREKVNIKPGFRDFRETDHVSNQLGQAEEPVISD